MKESKCGVCNQGIPINHCALHRIEEDKTITSYHMAHEGQLSEIEPCALCGLHRLLCDGCTNA
ncbi:hypothetical protein HWC53_gp056 [Bacillus phage vB_BmeM-Goe8]|uniref:Uncharacterized protein n=1 Tax=Bacillus phage vB_BmeM-Goe8 TaxID=2593638 RepID=A0A516KMM2_9CAUD|nr:hypothetical protein HWC53_gp056 [Bacillus phage vB_BmeM-Goe8]QDP42840.1 hypothetical protein Goe8_c00560 [Bacillus phage vB_BmeM-Goe8]